MADSNMTISAEDTEVTSGRKARLRKVTFTHTASGTAAGYATTTFYITGKLLRYVTTGGDSTWTFTLNDGTADIFASGNLTATATSGAISMHATIPHDGIALVEQYLTCTTAGVATTAPTITVIWEESDTI